MNEADTLLYRLNVGYENAESFRDLQGNETFLAAPSVTFLSTPHTNVNVDLVFTHTNTQLDRGQPIFWGHVGHRPQFNTHQPLPQRRQRSITESGICRSMAP
jgi:iron complex outermembrane receptor protein